MASTILAALTLATLAAGFPEVAFNASGECRGCLSQSQVTAGFDTELEDLHEARRGYYKSIVMQKLNLTIPQNISQTAFKRRPGGPTISLPDSLSDSYAFQPHDTPVDRKLDDFYGETKQYIVLARNAFNDCQSVSYRSRACLRFDFKAVAVKDNIVAAKLYMWVAERRRAANGLLQVRQLGHQLRPGVVVTQSPAPLVKDVEAIDGSGWLHFELRKDAIRSWIGGGGSGAEEVILEVACKDCGGGGGAAAAATAAPLVDFADRKPFIVVDVENADKLQREKRQGGRKLYCDEVPSGQSVCCIEKLQVNFKEFYPYIVEPREFFPNYCRGSCSALGQQIVHTNTNIVRAKLETGKTRFVPCCVPTRMASIDVLYYTDDGTTIAMKSMPNMVVEECGCM